MKKIEDLITESSRLITKASTKKEFGLLEVAIEDFKKAADVECKIANEFEKLNSKEAKNHWISAISCALEGEMYQTMNRWINVFKQRNDLNSNDKILIKEIEIRAKKILTNKILENKREINPF